MESKDQLLNRLAVQLCPGCRAKMYYDFHMKCHVYADGSNYESCKRESVLAILVQVYDAGLSARLRRA